MKTTRDPEAKRRTHRCRRRAAGLLILFAAAAALAVPTRTREQLFQRDPQTNHVWKTTTERNGYLALPRFLKRDRSPFPDEASYAVRYALRRSLAVRETRAELNVPIAAVEAGVLALLAFFDLFIYCPRRGRPRSLKDS